MSFSAAYRPPPPAPSAFFAIQLAQSASAAAAAATSTTSNTTSASSSSTASTTTAGVLPNPVSTPSAYLPRIPSKLSLHVNSQTQNVPVTQTVVPGVGVVVSNIVSVSGGGGPSPSRNNSASSITALPSLSSSLNNLHTATSIEHLDVCGTRTAEADELLRRVIQGNVKRMSNSSMGPVRNSSTTAGFDHVERTFTRYSDSESDDDDDDDDDDNEDGSAYYHNNRPSMGRRRSSGGSQPHGFNGPPAAQPSPLHSGLHSGAGRSGLIMNRSRKDRQARGVSAATFAF